MNGMWIRRLTPEDLTMRVMPFMLKAGLIQEDTPTAQAYLTKLIHLIHERLPRLDAAPESLAYFYQDWTVEEVALDLFASKRQSKEEIVALLKDALELLKQTEFTAETMETAMNEKCETLGWKKGDFFMPLRVAFTNRKVSPPLFTTMELIGRDQVIARMEKAIAALQK